MKKHVAGVFAGLIVGCTGIADSTQFELKDNTQIGISFENNLSYSDDLHGRRGNRSTG